MRTIIKLVFFILFLAIAGLIALPFVIDPNDYKQEIEEHVEKATGRTLSLEGDIELSVFPWIALELGPLALSNADGFKANSFAEVQAAEVRIKLMPLLQKKLEMDTVILDRLVLNLEKDHSGKTNWEDLISGDKTKTSDKKPPAKAGAAAGAYALAAVSIAGVQITNANVIWADAKQKQTFKLKNLNLNIDPLVPGEPTVLDMHFDIESIAPQAQAHIALNTQVMVDLENQQYTLTDLIFSTQANSKDLHFSQVNMNLVGDLKADMVKQLVSIDGLNFSAKASKDNQSINTQLMGELGTNLATQQSQIKNLSLTADITDPALPGGKVNIKLNGDVFADLAKQAASIPGLIVEIMGLVIKGDINVNKFLSEQPEFAGNINIDSFNLRQLVKQLAIELPPMADDSTLKLVQLNTEFVGTTNSINAKTLDITLDQSELNGSITINDIARPAIKFKLALDEFDADRYLPPVEKGDNAKAALAALPAVPAAGASQLPLETLRQLNAKGLLDIGKLKISGVRSENIHIELSAANGAIKLHPMSADLYQGQYQGHVTLDARGDTLKLAIDEHLKDIQAGALLKDLIGEDKISGVANGTAKLSSTGATKDQIKRTLTGNGNFSFTDGALNGINIADSIRQAKSIVPGQKPTASSDGPMKTDFSSLSGSFQARNGLISNKDLAIMSPLLRMKGAGNVDLSKNTADYSVDVSIVGSIEGQGGKELGDLANLTIPLKIKGQLDNLKVYPDLARILEQKAEITEKLQDKLRGDVGTLVGGLLDIGKEESTEKPTENAPIEQAEPEPESDPKQQLEDAVKDKLGAKLKGFF